MNITMQSRKSAADLWGTRNAFPAENGRLQADPEYRDKLVAHARAFKDGWLASEPKTEFRIVARDRIAGRFVETIL